MAKVKVWVLVWAGYLQLNRKDVPFIYKTRAEARRVRGYQTKVRSAVLIVDRVAKGHRA